MKLSIILGVAQMTFGICLSATNAYYYKRWVDIIFTFIPQLIFMSFLFGYLWIIIFVKWLTDYSYRSNEAPGLIPLFIQFFMSSSNVTKTNRLYPGQEGLQPFLLVTALIMVPVLLWAKPFVLKQLWDRKHHASSEEEASAAHPHHAEEFPMGEIVIHNSIHTVEFILGCVSNTASYLRLWALSLAHSELAKVFYDKVFVPTMEMHWAALFFGFGFWATATCFNIVLMESLSALLHALRLHWVEFQNKFYTGNGHKFEPFSFAKIIAADY